MEFAKGKYEHSEISIFTPPEPPEMCFFPGNGNPWVMKITQEGIKFNKNDYPNSTPDDFSQAIIYILEKRFNIKFTRNDDHAT